MDKLQPIESMYGIFTYIYQTKMTETQPNVGKYTIHGCYVQELM